MTTATQEAPIPQDLLDEIADLTEEVKRLDPEVESLARRIRSVSKQLHEFPIMTGGGDEWNDKLDEEIGDTELRTRAAVLIERLGAARIDPLASGGFAHARELGVGGFGIDHEDPDRE